MQGLYPPVIDLKPVRYATTARFVPVERPAPIEDAFDTLSAWKREIGETYGLTSPQYQAARDISTLAASTLVGLAVGAAFSRDGAKWGAIAGVITGVLLTTLERPVAS